MFLNSIFHIEDEYGRTYSVDDFWKIHDLTQNEKNHENTFEKDGITFSNFTEFE